MQNDAGRTKDDWMAAAGANVQVQEREPRLEKDLGGN
jgi:hypothetical protein